jgi:L,D-peptidoglycan transpeptidase YkuD (ErfK/YbiS/YcfS/YnhG family)
MPSTDGWKWVPFGSMVLGNTVIAHEREMKILMPQSHRPTSLVAVLSAALLVFLLAHPLLAELPQLPEPKRAEYRIAIHCKKNILQLWRYAELIREYPIETGKGGLKKKRSGDHRTPVGDYEVTWMASRNAGRGHKIVDGKSWCKGNKFVYAKSGSGLEKLWAEPYGGQEATVISINYPNAKEKLMGFTGECIHIHADKRHVEGVLKKSYGCIHMYPADAKELYDMVQVGTPVKILP